MKNQILILIFLLSVSVAGAFEPMSERDTAVTRARLIPQPASIALGTGSVVLDDSLQLTILTTDVSPTEKRVGALFPKWFGVTPHITFDNPRDEIPQDGYKLKAEGTSLQIAASNSDGVVNALKTLRQLAEPNRDTEKVRSFYIPELEISDSPALAFRGLHLCWFPETEPARIEQAIRLAAYYKYNYVVLEMWGTYRFEKRPEFCWQEYSVGQEEIRRLVELGREQGVTLIPQLNLFGHASASRSCSGKHVVLDFHPEYLPLFEPDGWTWCLSNPAVRGVLTDLVLELYDAFDSPPFFHLGCDEAFSAATCPLCRNADYSTLLLDHLTYFYNLLAEHGCRTMIWHDSLVEPCNFPGYFASGNGKTAGLLDKLPKGMIVCDWQYSAPRENEQWPTSTFFKEKGFDVLVCPWNIPSGIESLGRHAQQEKLMGLLETTWTRLEGESLRIMVATGARAAWETNPSGGDNITVNSRDSFNIDRHLRQTGWDGDQKRYGYKETGVYPWQIVPEASGSY